MLRRGLLVCGVLASLLYVATDVVAAIRYGEYHSFASRALSELMARGAPTEELVDPLFLFYDVLMMAFAIGLWISAPPKRARVTAGLLFAYAALGLLGPTLFEMDLRGTAGSTADVLHIVLTGVIVLLILASVAAGAVLRGRWFEIYSYGTLLVMTAFGILTLFTSSGLATGEPTPWLGITERIDIGAFLLWVAVLAAAALRGRSGGEAQPAGLELVEDGADDAGGGTPAEH